MKGVSVSVYRCPLHSSCACKSRLRVKRCDRVITLEICFEHNPDSHKNSISKKLNHVQKDAIITAVRGDPGVSSTGIRRHCEPTAHISVAMQRSVQYLVHKERESTMPRELGGLILDGFIASFSDVKDAWWFSTALERFVSCCCDGIWN